MEVNKTINIATANSCKSRTWQNSTTTVQELVDALRQPKVINLPFADFVALSKSEQLNYKDVGGFVGGTLKDSRRRADSVECRDFIALDFDSLAAGSVEIIKTKLSRLYGYAAVMYSTAKHTPAAPRLRIIVFLKRSVTAEEYEPVARYVAGKLGIDGADKTTYQPERMMFWPARCADQVDVSMRGTW